MTRRPSTTTTKTSAPNVQGAYPRARLFRELDRARAARVIWLWAPAGAGKTTLLATYAARRKLEALFYRVDRSDVDVATVFHFLRAACLERLPKASRIAIPRFTPEVGDVRAFARQYFHTLAAALPPRSSALCFDDAQEVDDDSVFWQVLREGIATLPPEARVFIASRRPPPPAFARGIAHGEITILDFESLRLRPEESRSILRSARGGRGRAGAERARALHERCGGWAAGLTLLGCAAETSDGPSADPFDGIARQQLFDYFATEVFAALQPEHRRIAMLTALFGSVDREVAMAVLDEAERAAFPTFLRELSLVERHGDRWRYHPLFRAFLLAQADEQLGSEALAIARKSACSALLERDRADEAFELAVGSSDLAELRTVILRSAPKLLEQGRTRTVADWTDTFPRDYVLADPWLALFRAQALLTTSPSDALALFTIAADSTDLTCAALGCAGALQANAFIGDDFSRMDPLLDRLLSLDPAALPPAISGPVTASVIAAIGFRLPGDARAVPFVRHAREIVRTAPNVAFGRLLGGMLVFHELFFGDPIAADNVVDQLLTDGPRVTDPFAQITVLLARAVRSWLRGHVDEAVRFVQSGLALASASGVHVWDDQLHAIGAAATIGGEHREAARELLDPLIAGASRSRFALGNAEFYRAWAALVWNDLDGAELHGARAYRCARDIGSPFASLLTATLMARIAIATGALDGAARYLAEAERMADAIGSPVNKLPVLVARALYARRTGATADERAALSALLLTTRATGVLAYFVVGRGDLATCTTGALRSHVEHAAARTLIETLELRPPAEARLLGRWPWPVRIRTFGTLEIDVHGEDADDLRARGRRTRELLGLVIALGPRPVTQTRLSDELWPDVDGDATRARLDTTLLRVRRQLMARDALQLANGRISLDPERVFVDVFAAEEWLRTTETALARRDPIAASDALVEALALVGGPLFADLEGTSFQSRRRKFERTLAALSRRVLAECAAAERARLHPHVARTFELCGIEAELV